LVDKRARNSALRADMVAVGWSLFAGAVMIAGVCALAWFAKRTGHEDAFNSAYPVTATLLLPAVQGVVLGLLIGPRQSGWAHPISLAVAILITDILGATIFLREGVICLILASPLLIGCLFVGLGLGLVIVRLGNRMARASLIPLLVVGAIIDLLGPPPDQPESVSDSVVIDAPPADVWRYIVSYPENTAPPEYWLWRIGLPEPIQSVAEAPAVGAKRECRFSKGLAFEEHIAELTPQRSMTFDVTKQPKDPEAMGHFRFDRGQLVLTALPGHRTQLTATSWYHLYVKPYGYFNWWTTDIVRQVHFRVMNRMKTLAERDYRLKG